MTASASARSFTASNTPLPISRSREFVPSSQTITGPAPFWPSSRTLSCAVILQRVVGGGQSPPLQLRVELRLLGDGPGWHNAADLEPEILVKGRCLMLVDDKDEALVFSLLAYQDPPALVRW